MCKPILELIIFCTVCSHKVKQLQNELDIIAALLNAAKCSLFIGSFQTRDMYAVILLVGFSDLLTLHLSEQELDTKHGPLGEMQDRGQMHQVMYIVTVKYNQSNYEIVALHTSQLAGERETHARTCVCMILQGVYCLNV